MAEYNARLRAAKEAYIDEKIEELREVLASAGRDRVESVSEEGRFPFMGEYDRSKRFLLSGEVGMFSYEQVKDWGKTEIIQALLRYRDSKIQGANSPYKPFGKMNFLEMETDVLLAKGDNVTVTVQDVIAELGGRESENLAYRLGASSYLFAAGSAHQEARPNPGTLRNFIASFPFEKYYMQALFDQKLEFSDVSQGVVLRSRGIPVSDAELLRKAVRSAYLRGIDRGPTPFAHEKGARVKLEQAWKEMVAYLVRVVEERISQLEADGVDWLNEGEEVADREEIEQIVTAHVARAINMGDILYFRAVHDVSASRYDEMDGSGLRRFRASKEKYIKIGENNKIEAVEGGISMDQSFLVHFEALWLTPLERIRVRPYFIKEDDGGNLVLEQKDMQLIHALADQRIPVDEEVLSKSSQDEVIELIEYLNKKRKELQLQEQLGATSDELDRLRDEISNVHQVLKRKIRRLGLNESSTKAGIAVSSLTSLIDNYYPADPGADEQQIFDHAESVQKLLTGFDLDLDSLVVEEERQPFGGTYTTFNPDQAMKIASAIRSAWYYWANDYKVRDLTEAEYLEMKSNYGAPSKEVGESNEDYEARYQSWKEEWKWRGLPLQTIKRGADGSVKTDEDGNPEIVYAEFMINSLYNFHTKEALDLMENQGRISKSQRRWVEQDFERVMGNDEDQLSAFMRIAMEKVIMMKLKEFREKGKRWTSKHSEALVEALSSNDYYWNRRGLRGIFMRKKKGLFGFANPPGMVEPYSGAGGWTKLEVLRMIEAIFGQTEAYQGEKKD